MSDDIMAMGGFYREDGSWRKGPIHPDVKVKLVGEDGNAFNLLGIVSKALRRAGYGDDVAAFTDEATSGDYDHLLATCMKWVEVH